MKTIWKYALKPGEFTLNLPRGARILTAEMQGQHPQLWALVDPSTPVDERRFLIAGTGHDVPDDPALAYVATFQIENGRLVFHLFEWATKGAAETGENSGGGGAPR